MGNFARALHHLDMKDVKRRHLKELAVKKIKEEEDKKEKEIIQEISKKWKSNWKEELIKDEPEINWTQELNNLWEIDWRDDLDEGMTTQMLTGILPSTGDADLEKTGSIKIIIFLIFINIVECPNQINFILSVLLKKSLIFGGFISGR